MVIALVAHDGLKPALLQWAKAHRRELSRYNLMGTGATARMLEGELRLPVREMASGPEGGDQQIGAEIVAGSVSMLVFFWDPLWAAPHGCDVQALLRIATLNNIPVAVNAASADAMVLADVSGFAHST